MPGIWCSALEDCAFVVIQFIFHVCGIIINCQSQMIGFVLIHGLWFLAACSNLSHTQIQSGHFLIFLRPSVRLSYPSKFIAYLNSQAQKLTGQWRQNNWSRVTIKSRYNRVKAVRIIRIWCLVHEEGLICCCLWKWNRLLSDARCEMMRKEHGIYSEWVKISIYHGRMKSTPFRSAPTFDSCIFGSDGPLSAKLKGTTQKVLHRSRKRSEHSFALLRCPQILLSVNNIIKYTHVRKIKAGWQMNQNWAFTPLSLLWNNCSRAQCPGNWARQLLAFDKCAHVGQKFP